MKKKIAFVLLIIVIFISAFSMIREKVAFSQLSFDEQVLEIMNTDNFSDNKSVDKIVLSMKLTTAIFVLRHHLKKIL